jgi:hypothetical protein
MDRTALLATVKHVTVNEGGQVIVGNATHGAPGET